MKQALESGQWERALKLLGTESLNTDTALDCLDIILKSAKLPSKQDQLTHSK